MQHFSDRIDQQIKRALQVLKAGGVLIYPTDTIWGLGCDATNQKAVDKIYEIKQRASSKSLIILVDGKKMLMEYVAEIPETIIHFLKDSSRPTTVIYDDPSGLAPNVVAADHTVAIRIVNNVFCQALISKFGKPIVSTSANFSNRPSPSGFDEIDPLLLKQADYIVNLPTVETKNPASRIIKLNELGEVEFLRK